jgi:hypothetical protein
MWWHSDNATFGLLLQGFAKSPNISGPYTFVKIISPLGNWSQDFGLFTDHKDGESYSLYSNGDARYGRDLYITALNNDTSELDKVIHRFDKYDLEGPSIVQTQRGFFMIASHKTGYRPNSATSISSQK